MNTFTRRSFLKGVLSLAASVAVPVELIEKATLAINTLPEVKTKSPAGYFKINGLLVPILWFELVRPMPNIVRCGNYSHVLSVPELSEILFTTTFELPDYLMRENVTFAISDRYLPFELTGNGYFTSYEYDGIVANSNEPIKRNYSMFCEIDQYRQGEYIY